MIRQVLKSTRVKYLYPSSDHNMHRRAVEYCHYAILMSAASLLMCQLCSDNDESLLSSEQ